MNAVGVLALDVVLTIEKRDYLVLASAKITNLAALIHIVPSGAVRIGGCLKDFMRKS